MPIQPLSDSAIRALGSSLVLNDARSVIKELIDNALDAHANTISIEISANTVDIIQFKDNGSGIGGDDRNLLCKRGCTSKIRTIQDLENLGGSSLGFRGEALASVAGLSNAVLVTTRIDGELVGFASKFGPDGHLLSSSSASHPVGTTIRVQDFLQTIPVRRQTALKAAPRTLTDIRKILQAYAFARPNVRISFKVLRAKGEKYNWTYGPQPGSATLLSATAKILGKEVAANCEARLWRSGSEEEVGDAYEVDAVMAKGDGDPIKVGNKGHFVSVDGRPVSTTRGVFRDFVKLYKTYYRHWVWESTSDDCSVDPFLCLHLQCPVGSYDVNVEPAKDEVLFTDTSGVRTLLEQFLKTTYGNLPQRAGKEGPRRDRDVSSICQTSSFDLLLAKKEDQVIDRRKWPAPLNQGPGVISKENGAEIHEKAECFSANDSPRFHEGPNHSLLDVSSSVDAKPYHNMYDFGKEDLSTVDLPLSPEQTSHVEPDDAELRKASVTNPWSIAKLNALVPSTMSPQLKPGDRSNNEQLLTPGPDLRVPGLVSRTHQKSLGGESNLPSPARSDHSHSPPVYQNPGPPIRRRAPLHRSEEEEDDIDFTQQSADIESTHGHSTLLDSWVKPTAPKSRLPYSDQASKTTDKDDWFKRHQDQRTNDFESTQTALQSTQLTDPTEVASQTLRSAETVRKPFISPLRTPSKPHALYPPLKLTPTTVSRSENPSSTRQSWQWSQDGEVSTSLASPSRPSPLSQSHAHPMASPPRLRPSPPQLSRPSRETAHMPNSELDEIMDFEYRKKAVNAHRRKQTQLTNKYLNPGQLAQIQRDSTASVNTLEEAAFPPPHVFRKPAAPGVNVRDKTEEPAYSSDGPNGRNTLDMLSQSGQELAHDSVQKQSPHQNRYEAAKAALSAPKSQISPFPTRHHTEEDSDAQVNTDLTESPPHLPEDDPRAYLMRHRNGSLTNTKGRQATSISTTLPHTHLKIKRIKTSKLPFGTIPHKSATHALSARPEAPFPSTQRLTAQTRELASLDSYPTKGQNQFVAWSADARDMPLWEDTIVGLVRAKYVAMVERGGEEVPAKLQMRLAMALRAHCEAFA